MNRTCPDAPRLDDYLNGSLPEEERRALERHLEDCARCRGAVEDLRRLAARAAALPRSEEPPRDLWPAIRAGLQQQPPATRRRSGGTRPPWTRWAGLAAAAALLVVVSVALTLHLSGRWAAGPAASRGTPVPAAFRGAEAEYARITGELLEVFEANRHKLSDETVAVVEQNLHIIDRAILETRAALRDEPDHPRLGHLLAAMYRQKVDLLRHSARLSVKI
jgi:anti-sigma-K factor RskA